ncbi:hypothetical protein KBY85_10540 [Cyanobium sp. BA5m-10]|uniref:beta strand repeat-containing protein n=1 Tax=Cyanobium sp. BA5m-10 TaxID=2823705 RepID=UPI0020CCAD9C|nr:hypothetical protein [Cyanobium sp. BA5m-10]MCP9904568.1 hypothetical protein [Cyanobium sp. BA5m-10]
MAIFYYNGIAAQGDATGTSSANASNNSANAIASLAGGVEVTAGTFTLTATQASGYSITGAGIVSISDPVTVSQANSLEGTIAATLSLSSISDTAANLAASSDAVLHLATTVTASTTATAAQATNIGGFTKAVTYSISDTATAVAGAGDTALNEAVNITATGTATSSESTIILGAANTGSSTIAAASMTAAQAEALTFNTTGNDTISSLTVTDAATVAQATALKADQANGDISTISIAALTDTAASVAAISAAALANVSGTVTANSYINQTLTNVSTQTLNVVTADTAVLDSAKLSTADGITIGAGIATIDASTTDEASLAAKTTVNNGSTLTINNYVNTDLSGLSNQGSGSIVVNTTTGAVLDESKLADATSVVLGATATGAAAAIDGIGTSGARINLNNQILNVSDYTNQDLSGLTSTGTLNVTTITGAVLDATKLATADSVTLVGTNTATAADADTLGSRLGGTATLNITTDTITANTNLSDIGSSLTLQFGGDTTTTVNGATLTVRQDQVSGYTISGTGTVAAIGTAGADSFNASGITATTNFTSLAGADSVTIDPSALGSVDQIDVGDNTDTLIFSAAASGVVDAAFTSVSSVETLQLAVGTNSISLGTEAEAAGIATVTGDTGADTLNLLYGTAGLTFNAGTGSDTLSYSADSGAQAITLSSISSGIASGSVVNNGTDSFTGLEAIMGGSGTADSITSTSVAEALIVTGANAGTIDGFAFSGVESVNLGAGNDTVLISSTDSAIGGNLDLAGGTGDTLSYAGYSDAVFVTLTGITSSAGSTAVGSTAISGTSAGFENLIGGSNSGDTITDSTGDSTIVISGANSGTIDGMAFSAIENLTLSTGIDGVTVSTGGALSGTLNLGDGASNTLTMVSGAGAIGAVTAAGGNDTITINGGTVTTLASLGSGTNALTIDNTESSIGFYLGGSGIDTLISNGGDILGDVFTWTAADSISLTLGAKITGKVTLGADFPADGSDTLTLDASSITGNVSTGSGADAVSVLTGSTITGNVTLGTNSDIFDGGDTLTLDASSITGNVLTGNGADAVSLSSASTITGNVTLGSSADGQDGNDSLTLASGSNIVGNVDLGAANDTLTLSTGINSATTIKGDVAFGVGTGDTLSYIGNTGPITVALDGISTDAVGTATGAKASYITGNVTGFEAIVGSDYNNPTSDSVTGDTIYDNTSESFVVLTGANAGTIDNLDFSSIENLQLRSGADTLSFQGTSGAPGLIAGRADGGGIEGSSYTNGVYSGGIKTDTGIDLLDYSSYQVSSGAVVDLSQNKATGVFGGLAGGLINGDGSIVSTTTDSSFENVDGSRFNDTITGDDQTTQANVLRGFDGADTIKGLAGNDTIDGGDGVGSNITDGADIIEGGIGADTIIASFGDDKITGGSFGTASDDSIDTLTYSATAISTARIEGLDISLVGTDTGTVLGDADFTLSLSTFTNTYNSPVNQQLITAPTNQVSKDWTQSYTDIQNLVLSEQSDILRIDLADVSTGSIAARGGSFDTLDYSSFGATSPVLVNLSDKAFSFDFDGNGVIDTTVGEITITNAYSATNVMVSEASSQGGANGVFGFEVVIGGAADDAIVGNADANLLVGNAGDDRIAGGSGNDTIYGGTGDDYITPGDGADYVVAGAGINTVEITSSDLAEDTFNVDPNGINIFALQGNGTDVSSITAPTGKWDPGSQGIDLLDGGDPVVIGSFTTYDTINGTSSADTYQFGGVAFKNIGNVDLGAGNDSVGTAATTKGVKVNYDGNTGTDSITLNLTFGQFAKLNSSGLYVADVQTYLDSASGKTFSSSQADFTANNFETGGVAVITPGVFNALQGDPAATTFNSAYGVRSSTISSGDDVNLSASALTTSTATALSAADIVSAFVQASGVKGSDAITITSGGTTSGSTTASQEASAVSRTVDDRADSVLAAYGLGTDRSSFTAGDDITLSLTGNVKADTTAEALNFVVNASGTVEAAGSRDSSLSAGDALSLNISGTAAQTVGASNVAGLALAALANRTYGIDDANLTDTATDSVQAGSDLSLQATASSSNRVTAQTVGTESLGTFTLVNNGTAATDRFTTTQIGADFPLINGDRVRFTISNGSVQADRDYYVANVIPITGEFQLSSEPNGDPIDVVAAGTLQAYRPAVATADGISTVTGVDLNRTGAGLGGVQAGDALSLRATASDAITATASSVAGDATAGVFRLGGMDGLNLASEVSTVQALVDTVSLAGSGASLNFNATDTATLKAASTEGAALTEANIQVFGSKSSASTAGDDLSLSANADLTLSGSASSTAGSAEARSGAGAGAGVTTAGVTNVLPTNTSYSVVTGLADGTQTAGADLAVQAKGATTLNASASTVSGAETLGSLWTSASGNILATFDLNLNTTTSTPSFVGPQYLAAGQLVQLPTAAAGLLANTDYAVKLLGFGAVDATANTLTMPTGISYALNDAVRFRLNSTTAPNSSESRYGLALGTTYYVKSVSGTTFTLSASPGGPVIDLSADSLGQADQLVDADRFQLLTLPTAPGGTYAVAPLTASASGVSLTLPSAANAFAGSRETDRTLNNSDNLNLAQVSGISGNGGLRGLIAGAQNAISAVASGVLNAVARNTANDATASAGLVAEGLSDTAISAGSAGSVNAEASIAAVADAATTGTNVLLDNALADLTITARGLSASNAANDITIGGAGDVQSTASLSGRSTASTVLGDSDALAALKATGLEALSNGITATIGQQGDISAAASIGSLAAPLLISALSSAEGDATAQAAAAAVGILGTYDATVPAGFSSLQAGKSQGDISGTASADQALSAIATNGIASVTLADVPGTGRASITGIENMALTAGAGLSSVDATAVGRANLSARSVELDATSEGSTSSTGVFSSTVAALPISFAEDGRIAAIAQQSSFAQSVTVNGNASTSLNNTSLGIGNATITIAGDGNLNARAISQLDSRSQSVAGDASA